MQYLVSVENSNYFYWQIELLIESFLMHGLQDNLVIAMADNDDPKISSYSKNLVKYCKKIIHPNFGKEKEYLPANRFYSLYKLFELGEIQTPFCIIHADMIMKNPIDKYNDKNYNFIINNNDVYKNYLTIDYIKESGIKDLLSKDENLTGIDLDDSIENFPYSMPIIFNENLDKDFLNKFFQRLVMNLDLLLKTKNSKTFPIEKTCWTHTFLESMGKYNATGKFLSCDLMSLESFDVPFIHYKNGIPPVFNKKFFKFEKGRYAEGPYDVILQNNPTENTDYLHQVIKSYLRRDK